MNLTTAEEAELLVNAEIPMYRIARAQSVGGSAQKAVLLAIWAYNDRPISFRGISARAGTSHTNSFRAVQALLVQKIIRERHGGGTKSMAYSINWPKLAKMQTEEPLFSSGGNTGTRVFERPVFAARRPLVLDSKEQ